MSNLSKFQISKAYFLKQFTPIDGEAYSRFVERKKDDVEHLADGLRLQEAISFLKSYDGELGELGVREYELGRNDEATAKKRESAYFWQAAAFTDMHERNKESVVRLVPERERDFVLKSMLKITKLARKLGVEPPKITLSDVYEQEVEFPMRTLEGFTTVKYLLSGFDVTIEKPEIVAKSGFEGRVAGIVEHVAESSREGFTIPPRVVMFDVDETPPAHITPARHVCDECNTNRKRVKTFILHDTKKDEFLQIGGSCVKTYTGVNPTTFFSFLSQIKQMRDEMSFRSRENYRPRADLAAVKIDAIISLAALVIEKDGQYIKNQYEEIEVGFGRWETYRTNSGESTADKVRERLYTKVKIDADLCARVRAYVAQMQGVNGYEQEIKALVDGAKHARAFKAGFIASLVPSLARYEQKQAELADKIKSEHVGVEGEKTVLELTIDKEIEREGDFGSYTLYFMHDDKGNQFLKSGTINERFFVFPDDKKRVKFNAEIRSHYDDRDGVKVTKLGRLTNPPKPKKSRKKKA